MSVDKRILYSQGQRVTKSLDGSRPGYRGDDAYGRSSRSNQATSSRAATSSGSKSNKSSNTSGAGNQNTGNNRDDYRANYSSKNIVKGGGTKKPGGGYNDAIVSGNRSTASAREFVNTLNRNNQIRAQQTGTRFTPYQGGARTTDYYNPNPLKNLLKAAAGFAIPGAGFLINKGGKLKDGIMSLNNRIQNSNFGRSTSLMDYLDMRKYGGYDEREMARRINMDEAKNLQARIDAGEFNGLDTMTDEVALTKATPSTLDLNKLETGDLNNLTSLIKASQKPQSTFELGYKQPNIEFGGTVLEDEFTGQPKEGIMSYPSELANEFQDMAIQAGNYSQNAVGNQLYGKEYDVLNPFEQQQIDKAIETYGTKSTGELASGTSSPYI